MKTDRTMTQSLVRVLLLTGFLLAVPLAANQFNDGEGWSLSDFALVGSLIMGTGLVYELAVKRPASKLSAVGGAGVAAIGGAAMVVGVADDAPGLVLIGMALVVTAVVIGIRTAQRVMRRPGGGAGAAESV